MSDSIVVWLLDRSLSVSVPQPIHLPSHSLFQGGRPFADRYFGVHSELLLFLTPHQVHPFCMCVEEVLPVFTVLFCAPSRADPSTLHVDFVSEGKPASMPVQFIRNLGLLPPLTDNFEVTVESIISKNQMHSSATIMDHSHRQFALTRQTLPLDPPSMKPSSHQGITSHFTMTSSGVMEGAAGGSGRSSNGGQLLQR